MTVRELMARVQEALGLRDRELAAHLSTDVTTIRKTRAGEDELPGHAKLRLLVDSGLVDPVPAVVALLPQRAREKWETIKDVRGLTTDQVGALAALRDELRAGAEDIDLD